MVRRWCSWPTTATRRRPATPMRAVGTRHRAPAGADHRRGTPADVRLLDGAAARPRRRPAPQPGQDGHGRVTPPSGADLAGCGRADLTGRSAAGVVGVGIDAVDIDRLRAVLDRRPGLATGCSPPASWPTPRGRRPAAPAGHPFRRQRGGDEGFGPRPRGLRLHDVEVVRAGLTHPAPGLHRAGRRLARDAGVVRWHLSLTHTDGWPWPRWWPTGPADGRPDGGRRRRAAGPDHRRDAGGRRPCPGVDRDRRTGGAGRHGGGAAALELMGGAYGRRAVLMCGKGNNGADGRVAASCWPGAGRG